MCTPAQFIGGLVAHEFHAGVRIHLGAESGEEPPNDSLKLTRLAGGDGSVRCSPGCARMGRVLPARPGSLVRSWSVWESTMLEDLREPWRELNYW